MLIDTNEENFQQRLRWQKEKLTEEKLFKGSYTADDIVLVRVTDHLPVNGVINSISNVPFVIKLNDLACDAIDFILEEQGLSWNERKEEVKKYTPLSTQYRSSIHFCLNGVVSSHMQGNFDGNPFVILEPFKEHEDDNNILAVRGEDTYFKDNLQLSNKAIILVDERYIKQVLESDITDKFQVVYYRGEQKLAIDALLVNMGIVPEVIGKDYIISSKTSEYISSFIDNKNYPQDKHCYSKKYQEDDNRNVILWQIYAKNFYTYLYTIVYGNIQGKEQEINLLSDLYHNRNDALQLLVSIIKKIGLDNYKKIVLEYNSLIMKKINEGNYPTNNQILEGASIDLEKQNILK